MPTRLLAVLLLSISLLTSRAIEADDWPQFRGLNASGVSQEQLSLPDLSQPTHLRWKVPVGKGHSSPVIVGGHLYLTSLLDDQLVTMALDADSGKKLWQAAAEYKKLESVHRIGSPATPSVVADDEVVISFFGSSGLHCYSSTGKLLWKQAMGPFDNGFGAASSPILVDDQVILLQDHDTNSFLAAYDKQTGSERWRVKRPQSRRNYSSPIVWKQNDVSQIVVAGTAQVNAYDAATGKQLWFALGGARVVSATPVVADNGQLYVANSGGGEAPNQPTFAELMKTADGNKNGMLEASELPKSIIRNFFSQFDGDKDGSLSDAEYTSVRDTMMYAAPIAMAIKPGGDGDITDSHVLWTGSKSIPRNASPLVYDGHMFLIKDGGVLTVLDAANGKTVDAGRLRGSGKFFSSPVVGDGKLYAVSDTGKVNVITATPDWKQLATVELGEDVYSSPAIANGNVYVRTVSHLYCYGNAN